MAVPPCGIFDLAQKFSRSSKNQATSIRRPSADGLLSINTLIEEIKPIVIAKYDLEYRDMSQAISFLAFLDYQHSNARIEIRDFCIENSFSSIELSRH